ncbi:23S rRNA (uracil(1939)-C(5))-methyltransferase RlmD [Novilysobacter defluvii]|uniref:23S rRNA (uracil(1939)-C(5))-methyltransferase RlmD n=1 Tax=Lysobacter defluvii IMMIB APB-9 = DSM 18482 TaxID=1385515 RepID=A0A0A0M9I5_9GAMM|nr:23S rRNA (uracil(1939)-C(5))-methyltransferase RlmD [Lysobacter defluvii]KGO99713.1 23S rRNA methyltransferase [Lysobacter defluvii IMMIB APB-9 = DSM 18482]
MARIDKTPFEAEITDLTHDGRGVARRPSTAPGEPGKAVFVTGALPGERVRAVQTRRHRSFDEAQVVEVLEASPHRVDPLCSHYAICSGCSLQHLEEGQQILAKQRVLLENLQRIGHVTPERVLEPLVDSAWGYRRKGRFSVRRVEKKGRTLVGFRERDPRFVAELEECRTVVPRIGTKIGALARLVDGLEARATIPQIEFIAGEPTPDFDGVALTFRHLEPLSEPDRARLVAFGQEHRFAIFLQPGGVDSVHPLWPQAPELFFNLPQWDLSFAFQPLDFIQVNAGLNGRMIERALDLLDAGPGDRVLDLFCGLGNFTLPLARGVREVVGVEGEPGLVARARANAERNGIGNARFFAADLGKDLSGESWMREGFDRLLLDPPRSGADFVLAELPLAQFRRIVYVSCHPASLARDAGFLVNEKGWKLRAAGVMDMFPHTGHVESIAMFEPGE